MDFWVQLHNIPTGFASLMVAKQLGDFLGSFFSYDETVIARRWRSYMRIRVAIDIRKPLKC